MPHPCQHPYLDPRLEAPKAPTDLFGQSTPSEHELNQVGVGEWGEERVGDEF